MIAVPEKHRYSVPEAPRYIVSAPERPRYLNSFSYADSNEFSSRYINNTDEGKKLPQRVILYSTQPYPAAPTYDSNGKFTVINQFHLLTNKNKL